MRATFFLRLVLFVTTVWAGGYQYFLELLVNALTYEIDGLNKESDQVMGFGCPTTDWDDHAKKCKTSFQKWPSAGSRANIDEILTSLINLPAGTTKLVRDSNNKPVAAADWVEKIDLEKTAVSLFDRASAVHGGKPPQRRDYELSKNGKDDWAKHAEDVGRLIQRTGQANWSKHRTLFEKTQSGFDLIIKARQGDNARFQVKDFKKALGWDPTTKEITNPRNPSNPWKVVDFKQTITDRAAATGQSREDVAKEVAAAAKKVYSKPGKAKDHKVVIDANRRAQERVGHCIS